MLGEGVHNVYEERAKKGGDVLWHVTIKGRKNLTENVPLHMSLKVFEDKKDMNLKDIKSKVKEFNITTPDPKKLKFETTIFTSERDGKKYFMLKIYGTDKSYENFYDSLKHCGTTYKQFMPHVTIDKDLYDQINREGLKPEEVKFGDLTIEHGAGNTIHEFKKSEDYLSLVKETILLNSDLEKFSTIICLDSKILSNYLQDSPYLEEQIFKKHEDRIYHHFGESAEAVELAWKHGIDETYNLLRKK